MQGRLSMKGPVSDHLLVGHHTMTTTTSSPTAAAVKSNGIVIVAALMLFSMFFGAGNLIFPPMLGIQAGTAFTPAMIGFLLTGVALPVLSVVAVAITGNDVYDLAQRGGKVFGILFPVLVYLSIGAFYALPRTATVSYSTAIQPITGLEDAPLPTAIFSAVFFLVSLALAFDPSGIADKLGKYLTPVLLALLVLLVILSMVKLDGTAPAPAEGYDTNPLATGLISGYMTMDSLAALAFGIMIVSSLRYKGLPNGPQLVKGVSWAAIGAGALLGLIYVGLGAIGLRIPNPESFNEGAAMLAAAAQQTMGTPGMIVFGGIVLLACLSTAAGLIGATSEFFTRILPVLSYKGWAILFAVISLGVATLGLEAVLSIAGPIIGFLYPSAITLVALTLAEPLLRRKLYYTFRFALILSVVWAGLMTLASLGVATDTINMLIGWSPMSALELGWVTPVVVVAVIGFIADVITRPTRAVPVGGEHQLEAELRGGHSDVEALNEAVTTEVDAAEAAPTHEIEQALGEIDHKISALADERAEATARVAALDEALDAAHDHKAELQQAHRDTDDGTTTPGSQT